MKNDISTKIVSLLFAIILWFYIIQVQSPEVERTVKDVPVLFTQTEALENRQLMLVNDKEYTVNVKIRGQRKYILDINKTNLSVSADVSNIENTGTHTLYTNVVVPYGNIEIVNKKPSVVSVMVDEIVEQEKEILVETKGKPENGYTVGAIKTTPAKIKIKGAKSIVGAVDHILAVVNVSGKSEDVSSVEPLELIGTTGTVIDSTYVSSKLDAVTIHCEILKTKDVDIEPKFSESLIKDGTYVLDDNSVKQIEVAGTASAVEKLYKIETRHITREMIKEGNEVEVELLLPSGVKSLDGDKITLKLKKVK